MLFVIGMLDAKGRESFCQRKEKYSVHHSIFFTAFHNYSSVQFSLGFLLSILKNDWIASLDGIPYTPSCGCGGTAGFALAASFTFKRFSSQIFWALFSMMSSGEFWTNERSGVYFNRLSIDCDLPFRWRNSKLNEPATAGSCFCPFRVWKGEKVTFDSVRKGSSLRIQSSLFCQRKNIYNITNKTFYQFHTIALRRPLPPRVFNRGFVYAFRYEAPKQGYVMWCEIIRCLGFFVENV